MVLKHSAPVFASLYFRILSPNWPNFFGH